MQPNLDAIANLDPDALVGFRGSLARGFKGPQKGGLPFDPNNFDVDAFIVSDDLAGRFGKVPFRSGADIPEIAEIQTSIDSSLRQDSLFSGLRSDSFTFRIFTQQEIAKLNARADAQYYFLKKP